MLDKAVRQGRLTMVDMGNNGEISDMLKVSHTLALRQLAGAVLSAPLPGRDSTLFHCPGPPRDPDNGHLTRLYLIISIQRL